MTSTKSISIIGGGLAGLTLGIGLRQRGIPATVWEAGHYPRHRVCGEFISGNGQRVLERLGLTSLFVDAGAIRIHTAQFFAGSNHSPIRTLPPALGLSRFKMDALLAGEFQRLGGELHQGTRSGSTFEEGAVFASGRRPQPMEGGWRWFGLKAHARNIDLTADLEMHISPHSYVGVNRIDNGEVNVCGLFRARPGNSTVESKFDLLRGTPGSSLFEKLEHSQFDENSFCSVAGLCLKPQRANLKSELCIGDALTMIPPATGNGMSMAFESAEIAIEPLAAYSRGEFTWSDARQIVARECDSAFVQRLRWARLLQGLMFSPIARNRIGLFLMRSGLFWNWMFSKTR
jgi:hypothetical protein